MRQMDFGDFLQGFKEQDFKSLEQKSLRIEEAEKNGTEPEKIRELEMALFRPSDIDTLDLTNEVEDKESVTIYFRDERYFNLFAKYIKVNTYMENNAFRIEDLLLYLLLLDKGFIEKKMEDGKITLTFKVAVAQFLSSEVEN